MENNPAKFMIMNLTDIRLATLIQKYDTHTLYFSKTISEIEKRDFSHLGDDAKKISWLIGSQVQLRFEVANLLGIDETQIGDTLFRDNVFVQFSTDYPSIQSFQMDWKKISPILRVEILELDNEDLFSYSKDDAEMKGSLFDLLSSVIEREAICISVLTVLLG